MNMICDMYIYVCMYVPISGKTVEVGSFILRKTSIMTLNSKNVKR